MSHGTVCQPREYLVLTPAGDVVGVARLSDVTMGVREVARSTAWVTVRDDDGFVSVVRFRVASN